MGIGWAQGVTNREGAAGARLVNRRCRTEMCGGGRGLGGADRRGGRTHSEEHGARPLTASGPSAASAQDAPLLRQQVELEGLDEQVLAVRVVSHQALRVHVAQQEVPAQQRQTHALHQLGCRGPRSGSGQGPRAYSVPAGSAPLDTCLRGTSRDTRLRRPGVPEHGAPRAHSGTTSPHRHGGPRGAGLTRGTCCLRASTSCLTQLSTAR